MNGNRTATAGGRGSGSLSPTMLQCIQPCSAWCCRPHKYAPPPANAEQTNYFRPTGGPQQAGGAAAAVDRGPKPSPATLTAAHARRRQNCLPVSPPHCAGAAHPRPIAVARRRHGVTWGGAIKCRSALTPMSVPPPAAPGARDPSWGDALIRRGRARPRGAPTPLGGAPTRTGRVGRPSGGASLQFRGAALRVTHHVKMP